jgi:hypothetical protein
MLLTMTCPRTDDGWLAEELAAEQTLDNLASFANRLLLADRFRKAKGKRKEAAKEKFLAAQSAMWDRFPG